MTKSFGSLAPHIMFTGILKLGCGKSSAKIPECPRARSFAGGPRSPLRRGSSTDHPSLHQTPGQLNYDVSKSPAIDWADIQLTRLDPLLASACYLHHSLLIGWLADT